jgi:hypothetical protein
VFRSKLPEPEHTGLIDLLLNADAAERKLVIFEALKGGEIKHHEVEGLLGLVARLERAAGPRTPTEPKVEQPAA